MEGVPTTFTSAMNGSLAKDIMEKKKLASVVTSMLKGKAPRHDGIPIEFF